MRKTAAVLLACGLAFAGTLGAADAQTHGGARGGGGYHGSGGFYGGFRGGYGGPRVGVVIGAPYYDPFWDPFWGYSYYPYSYPPYPYRYREPLPPPDYGDYSNDVAPQGPPPAQSWYYCDNPKGYYPYVKTCRDEWQPVPATPPQNAPAPPVPEGAPRNLHSGN